MWAELTPEEMRAATTLGFEAVQWENGMTPDAIALPWSALPPQLRMQLLVAINMRTLSNVRMAFGHVARGHAFMHACTDRALHTQMY